MLKSCDLECGPAFKQGDLIMAKISPLGLFFKGPSKFWVEKCPKNGDF
jgi:hypothetical protein